MQEKSAQTQTGNLIESVAEGFQLELGFNLSLATLDWSKVKGYVTNSWYGYLAEYFHNCNKNLLIRGNSRIELGISLN